MNKRLLKKTVLALVLGGTFATSSWASAASLTITGTDVDTAVSTGAKTVASASTTNVENNKPTYKKYTYSGDVTLEGITLEGSNAWLVNAKSKVLTVNGVALANRTGKAAVSVTDGGDFNFTSTATTTSDLELNSDATGAGDAYGFYLIGSNDKKSLGYMPFITTRINSITSDAGAYGLYADNSIFVGAYGTAVKDFAIGSMNGDTIIYGVSTTAAGTDKAAGIYATNNSQVLVPKYTAYVQGNGAVAEDGAKVALGSDKVNSTVTVYVDKENTNDYAALRAKGGQIDVDLQDKWVKGEITYGAAPKGLQTNINGNLVAEGGQETESLINLSLSNEASTWEGVAHSTGDGSINLWLGNGANWTNEQWGNQSGFSGSHIHELNGGDAGKAGYITQKDSNDVTIDKFSGNVKVFYEHDNDGSAASDYAAGDIKVKSAAADSSMTLITDNGNISMDDASAVEKSLNTLAGKLAYTGYVDGEDNLIGCVQIAEGLTSTSATLKEGFIAFDEGTGKGSYAPMYKEEQTETELQSRITGSSDIDRAYIKAGILREDGKYHFDKDTTINLNASGTEYRGITNTGDVVIEAADKDITLNVTGDATTLYGIKQDDTERSITITAKNLNINADGEKRVEAINLYNKDIDNANTMNIDGNVNIYAHAGGTALMGIHAVANSYLNITGDLNIKNPNTEDGKWGTNAYGSNDKTIGNSYFGNAAVYLHSGMAACQKSGGINVGGDVDIVSQAGGLYINGGGGVINIEGGGRIETDPTVYQAAAFGDAAYAAIRAESGHVYMNVVKDTEGAIRGNVTGAGDHKVNILGNIDVTAGAYNLNLEPSKESTVSVGLATEDSSWTGVAYNAFPDEGMGGTATSGTWKGEERKFTGAINVWLQNGATWTNEKYGTVEKPYAGLKFDDYGSRLAKLAGGDSEAKAGIIYQKDIHPITIDEYSGNTKVFYEHTNDGDEASDYAAGDITIKKAAADSAITLITDNSGIADVKNADETLNALANKLTYAAAANGERNLSGKVEIAEGLTSSSASLRLEKIDFDAEDGKGKLYNPYKDEQEVFEFTDPILGNPETDTAYIEGGVLRKNGIYTFDGDTTIDSAGASVERGLYGSAGTAIIDASSVNQHTVLDLQGHNLNVKGTTANGLIDIMATGVVDTKTKQLNIGTVEINNPGQIVLEASRTGASGYPTPVYVNGGGKIVIHNGEGDLDSKVVTIKSETPNNDQFCGIKTMNGVKDGRSQVIIDGLVDIETSAYRANPGTSIEGISNVASTVSVGGGTIKLTNEDENGRKGNGIWAIRSYGEFTSSNPGYVYFNAVHEGVEGAATGSGENKAVIEGDVGMSGSMNVIGSINVGFGTEDSYFKGNVRSTGSYGAAQGNGAVNLWFTPGSYWEGNNISNGHDTNVSLDGADWTGYSSQQSGTTKAGAPIGFNLNMKNGSSWKNTGNSYALSVSSDDSTIDMTDASAGNVVIDNYSGNTKVFYAHENDGDEASDYAAGDITIKKAAADSAITLITDNSGIADVKKANATLNALANKLTYAAYVDGEKNLSGKVEIAEGLTSSSISLRLEDMTFDEESGQGMYEAAEPSEKQTVFDYDAAIDNNEADDQEYVDGGVRRADGTYKMDGNTTIALKDVAVANSYIMNSNKNDLTINAGNNELKTSIDGTKQIYGLLQKDNNQVDITASKFVVDVTSTGRTEAISVTNTDANKKAVININADTYLTSNAGSSAAIGIHATGNSEVNINGNLTMKGDGEHPWGVALEKGGYSYFGAAALYSHNSYGTLQKSGDINVNGLVDIEAYANGAYVNGGGGTINIAGGSIKMNKEDTAKGYAALRAESGHINMNMNADNSAAGTNKVNILGNVDTTAGAYNLTLEPCEESVVNLGMATEDSTWTGVAYNAFPDDGMGGTAGSGTWKGQERNFTGAINLWLENGATWNNELYGITEKAYMGKNFEGSHLAKLSGGNSAANAGIIFQKDANPLTIDAYSGNTKVFYEHTNDGAASADYAAGDITIKTAAADSAITLITDNSGISDVANANDTLNALANKLTYAAYVNGEKNLSGKVEIAEGLTSSSISLRLEDMTFDEESGQGMYEAAEPSEKQTVFDYNAAIDNNEADDQEYVDGGVRRADGTYKMDGNTTIALKDVAVANSYIMNTNENDLTINAGNNELKTSIDGTKQIYGILQKDNNQIDITASKFVVDVTSTARTEAISVTNTDANKKAVININADTYLTSNAGSGAAIGIHATGNSEVNINGNLTMKGDGEHPWGVALEKGGYSYFGAAALYSHNSYGALQKSGDINVNGLVDIEAYANGAYVNGGGGTINIAGGSIKMNKEDTAKGYAALRAESGHINMNMNSDNSAAGTNKVNILGNVDTTAGAYNLTLEPCEESVVNLGMSTEDSTWTGVAYNAFPDDGMGGTAGSGTWKGQERKFTGAINLWLENGATWNNELYGITEKAYMGKNFEGSHLAKLTGGNSAANAGIIFQKDANPLTIDAYSGNTKVFYEHTNDGAASADYAAGDITIKTAAADSAITLITDNSGISDVANANDTLNALANKLTYAAYANGEKNLSGKVEIAEGLTSSSASLRLEDMSFNEESGQGYYEKILPPGPGPDPDDPIDSTGKILTGTMNDKSFMKSKISESGNQVNYDLTKEDYTFLAYRADAGSKSVANLAPEGTLTLGGENANGLAMLINDGADVTVNGNLKLSAFSESYGASGISMMIGGSGVGEQSHLLVNGHVTIGDPENGIYGVSAEDKHGAYETYKGSRWTGTGINVNQGHGSTLTITDGVTMLVDGHGIVTDPYYSDAKYDDKELAVVNVNGPVNIKVEAADGEEVGLYSLANFGGTINVGMKDGKPAGDDVKIYGNTLVMKDIYGENKNPYYYRNGVTNLALTTANSEWTGVIDNTGTQQAGEFNLFLQNGATWNYKDASITNGLAASTMPQPSINFYGNYDNISHVAKLTGGSSEKNRGVIKMSSNDNIEVDNYSGNTIVLYEHESSKPTSINGGDFKVKLAELGSVITLSTDRVGITEDNNEDVMDALANKLYYLANDNALIGKVQIAEGLTAASETLYTGNIGFDQSNGQGYYTKKADPTVIDGAIGEPGADNLFDVTETEDSKIYSFDESKKVTVKEGAAVRSNKNKTIVVANDDTLLLGSEDETSPIIDATKGDVDIQGEIKATATEDQNIAVVGADKKLNIAGADLVAEDGNVLDMANGSVVNLGVKDNNGEEKEMEPTGKPVKVEGNINNNGGTLNMALDTADSNWNGDYQGKGDELNLNVDNGSSFEGTVNGEKLNINLNNGTWINTGASESSTGEMNLNAGGTDKAKLDMSQGSGDLKIDNYSGGMTIFYDHDKDDPTSINGGNVTIGSAAEKSEVNLMTTGAGVDTDSEEAIKDTLNALANKLYYTNFDSEGADNKGNLSGKVGIGEGLTRPEIFNYWSGLQFDSAQAGIDGKIQDNKPHGDVIYGDKETGMMRGAKMAMASTAMVWREESNDLMKRMGDLRLRKEEAGVWAKYYTGRNEYNNKGSFKNKYKAVQVGVDKELGNGWLGGVAFSYDDGSTHMNNGGYGDVGIYNLGVYATKQSKSGEFIDVIAKAGRLENDYTIYNDYGYSLDGDYKSTGMSLSMEYGKKFSMKNGLVLTPSAEFTMGRIGSKSYDAYSEHYKKNLHVEQDTFNTAVGRLSLGIGKETDKYTYFAKASLAHEFGGDFNTTYSAKGEPTSSTSLDFAGTWKEIQLGGSVKLNNDAVLYGTFGRSFGGNVTENWRIDAGINLAFNHLSDFFGTKHKEAAVETVATPVAPVAEPVAPAMSDNANAPAVETTPAVVSETASAQVAAAPVAEVYAEDNSYQANDNNVTVNDDKGYGEFYLDGFIVTASRTPQRITDATADVSVVTRAELEEKHVATVEEALRNVPGVQFNNYGSGNQMNANISSLRINGSKDIAILVDGVKINDFQGVGEAGNMYAGVLNNINNIERIEVLRGAAGVLYGSGAKGGVINIITREVEENKTVIDASFGSFNREDYKVNSMGKAGKFSYNLYQGTFRQGDVTDGRGDKWEGHTKTRNGGAKFTYKFTDNNKLTVDYMDINSRFGGTDLIYNNFYKGKFASTMWSIRDDWKIGKHWNNTIVYRQNEEKRQHQQEYFAGNKLTNANTDYKYQFISDQVTFSDDRHNLTFGFDYSKGKDQNYTIVNGVEAKREMKNMSVYANGEWKVLPSVTLTAGIRHDRPERDSYGSELSSHTTKGYKLSWDITKNDTLYAGRSEYFILPSMNQLYDKEWGNAGLKPAEGRTSSIGYNKKFDNNNFFTVNYFQTKEDCGIGWDGYNRVNTKGISRGWNAQYTSRLSDKWDFQLGWSHLYERSGANDNYTYGYYPKDLATFGVNYNCGKFSSALDGRWFIRRKDNSGRREFPVDNYGIYNFSMNYKPTDHMKFYLKVENIFDKFYCEHTDAGNDPFLTGGGERKYYAMPGRAIMVGTQFTF